MELNDRDFGDMGVADLSERMSLLDCVARLQKLVKSSPTLDG